MFRVIKKPIVFMLIMIMLMASTATSVYAKNDKNSVTPDTIYYNGTIITMNDDQPIANSIAIKGDKIVAVGDMKDLKKLIGKNTKIYNLDGRTIIPGLQDSHIHWSSLGLQAYYYADFNNANNIAEIQQILKDHIAKLEKDEKMNWTYQNGEFGPFVFGSLWNQDKLVEKRMANRHELDAVTGDIPVLLDRIYEGVAVNTKAFELLGFNFDDQSTWPEWFTKDPENFGPGDIIERDENGLPTGVFYGRAISLVSGVAPSQTFEQKVESVELGAKVLMSKGIVSTVYPGASSEIPVYKEAYDRGLVPIRTTAMAGIYRNETPDQLKTLFGELEDEHNKGEYDLFRVRGVKFYTDGGLGSRSAAVSEPFLPIPSDPLGSENYGTLVEPDYNKRLEQFRTAAELGWEMHTHSIGDVAIRQTMDAYKTVMDEIWEKDPEADLRYSIEHLYLPNEPGTSVVKEMAEYGVFASINPGDIYVEGDSFLQNAGPERMARWTPFKTLLDNGVMMVSGSDWYVAPYNPWIGIYSMVARKTQVSGEVLGPEERISLMDALKTYTINGAYYMYDEDRRGSLEPGKLADLVVIDADLLNVPDEEILEMGSKVGITMVNGEIGYQKPGFELQYKKGPRKNFN